MKYILRLDDACPTMNFENWDRIEKTFDNFGVKPIVGIIPENRDGDFRWQEISDFWDIAKRWENKGWCIALHGLNHNLQTVPKGTKMFQKSHRKESEFAGYSYEEQLGKIKNGIEIMKSHNVSPTCFYAPAHTFDKNTVEALKACGESLFVSDGFALRPYKKNGMVFLPSNCDGPFKLPDFSGAVMTYVFHPSKMDGAAFERLENFLEAAKDDIISTESIDFSAVKKTQGFIGGLIEILIYIARGIRGKY